MDDRERRRMFQKVKGLSMRELNWPRISAALFVVAWWTFIIWWLK